MIGALFFRLSIGHDSSSISSAANGKLAFSFTNSDGTHDKYDAGYLGNLKDDQWHDIVIMFEVNEPHGLKYYVDGSLTYLILSHIHPSAINPHQKHPDMV